MTHLLGKKRKFGGKSYTALSSHETKTTAKKVARGLRKEGWRARVIPVKPPKCVREYYVYLRKRQ